MKVVLRSKLDINMFIFDNVSKWIYIKNNNKDNVQHQV
jgi:hypothetical protein